MVIGIVFLTAFSISVFHYGVILAEDNHYANEWAVEIAGGRDVAEEVAKQHGYRLVREFQSIPDHYLLERSDVPFRSRRSADHHTKRLSEDSRVTFAEQQKDITRVKRDLSDRDIARRLVVSGHTTQDPDLPSQWYLNPEDTVSDRRDGTRADLKVKECWRMNITGKGVVVTILDDGLEREHPDLKDNYDPDASYDFNDNDADPTPRYDITNENKHGTRCGGEVSMIANNNNCGVGIAFDSRIGGVRMLDGRVTDTLEGEAVSFNRTHIDIYSASWGPNDDGKTLEGPGNLAAKALELGIKEGRQGKGVLYAWASGNGGTVGDNCNADGYTSSIYTISVSSATQFGNSPWYAEKCASTITSAYSSGATNEGKIVSSDLHGKCTHQHTGTSAAAPLAAGILALLLERNPDLTWRDVQHIIVHTSKVEPLGLEKGWYVNGVGYCVNIRFGFGLMDAKAMIDLADPKTWQSVGEQKKCIVEAEYSSGFPKPLSPGHFIEVTFTTNGCAGESNEINYLEHIQVVIDLDYDNRGKIYAEVVSPMGTITPLFLERKNDKSNKGFKKWPLMSVHNWGENPKGIWKFRVSDRSQTGNEKGQLKNATLVLYGTKEQPAHQQYISKCNNLNKFVEHMLPTRDVGTKNKTFSNSELAKLQYLLNDEKSITDPEVKASLNSILEELNEELSAKSDSKSLRNFSEQVNVKSVQEVYLTLLKRI
ncbi:neuroendocrine convertase 1-like isoform X3 [Biomphalaria glabrata]|uniref:Neuroendocrine convertase 1-like isoform X3 n=1 Tax=Biomphalaria glabrata TaxID=6526 RepID=A0A9W2Z8U9_BIOGL|nr:neuroendocrine convertase 1-like isoform X3 [Biomphalaria glabrata]